MIDPYDADCHYGDHHFGPGYVNCSHCGYVNVPNLLHLGRVGKVMKRTGLQFADAEMLMFQRQIARALVNGKLGERIAAREAIELE